MKVIFVSSTCSSQKYNQIFHERTQKLIDPSQKFFDLLLQGMTAQDDTEITCLSAVPVSASCHPKKMWEREEEQISDSFRYIYVGFRNGKLSRYFTLFFSFLKELKKASHQKDVVILCDPLLLSGSLAINWVTKFCKIKKIAIVTDLPDYIACIGHKKRNFIEKNFQKVYDTMSKKQMESFDGYIFLTKQMDEAANLQHKPSLIIEGSVDSNLKNIPEEESKEIPRTVVYAGGLHEKFGVVKLVKAFQMTTLPNTELHLYGEGQAVSFINEIAKKETKIQYKGVLPFSEIADVERKATLLVNPRPSGQEFTKYSFPSKTLEYMVSGTPLLTTKLPGIPEEYFDYLYTFPSEAVEEMASELQNILGKGMEELNLKGKKAKEFVLTNKNNILQGKKVIKFLRDI